MKRTYCIFRSCLDRFLTNGCIFVVSRLPQLAVLAKILCLLMVSIFTYNFLVTFIEIAVLKYKYMYIFRNIINVRESY